MEPTQRTAAQAQPSATVEAPIRPTAVSVSSQQVPLELLRKYSSPKPLTIQTPAPKFK